MYDVKILFFIQLYCQFVGSSVPGTVEPVIAGGPDFSECFVVSSRDEVKGDIFHLIRVFFCKACERFLEFTLFHNGVYIVVPGIRAVL